MTFTGYLSAVRISNAVRMLNESTLSMTEISRACGFGTIRSFNRVFKSVTGYSPSTLPSGYKVERGQREYTGREGKTGVDPTLATTEVII